MFSMAHSVASELKSEGVKVSFLSTGDKISLIAEGAKLAGTM